MKRRGWSGGTGDYRHFEREVAIMAKREKRMVAPLVDIRHDYKDTGFTIKVDLAGAAKESVGLEMGNGGFCVKGEGDDFRYESCFMLAHEVKPDKAKAKFDAGLLTIHVPFNETWRGHKVPIER
jgi:HSP20 family molecular chaperone IbpA